MNPQLENVNEVLKTDLSSIVQRVSLERILTFLKLSVCNVNASLSYLMCRTFFPVLSTFLQRPDCLRLTNSKSSSNNKLELVPKPRVFLSQGYSSLNDTPHMVIEQTRSVVESKWHVLLRSFIPAMCLTTRMDYINQQDFLQLSLFFLQNVVNFKFESEVNC